MNRFAQRARDIAGEITANRRWLHQNAEVTDELPATTKFVMEKLTEMGLAPREIAKSGVVACIKGGQPGKTILLRADMDALPMAEKSGLPFASKTQYAHTCGHDMHTAMLLGATKLLQEVQDELCGSVKLMFQPAEEVFTGAAAMLKAGLMDGPPVDAALGIHVMSDLPLGTVANRREFITSSCDGFSITIHGRGCHGAQPHLGIDPIAIGVQLHQAFQELIARETPPDQVAILTVCQFSAGTTANIVPETAILKGTMRCYDKDLRAHLQRRFREMIDRMPGVFGGRGELEVLSDVPAIYNNPALTDRVEGYLEGLDMGLAFAPDHRFTASDDFARVAELVPTVFMGIGARPDGAKAYYPNHNPNVVFNEACLPIGTAIHAQSAFAWLKENA